MIKILKAIYSILSASSEITAIVSDKIFPDIVPDKDDSNVNIEYPLIIMRRVAIDPTQSKCKSANNDRVIVEIICYSISYNDAVDLAQAVRDELEFYKGTVESIRIDNSILTGMAEDFTEGVYYQLMTFNIS